MAFRVEISPEALENLDAMAAHIQQHGSIESAERWFNGIVISIRSLGEMPSRCPLANRTNFKPRFGFCSTESAIAAIKSISRFISHPQRFESFIFGTGRGGPPKPMNWKTWKKESPAVRPGLSNYFETA